MKVTLDRKKFLEALKTAGRALPSSERTMLPILNFFRIEASRDRGGLIIIASDLGSYISCGVEAVIEEEGIITQPAKMLLEVLDSIDEASVSMELSDPAQLRRLKLSLGRNEVNINFADPKDYPPLPPVNENDAIMEVPCDEFRVALDHVYYMASKVQDRPVLSGVYFACDGKSITVAAADGFRLGEYRLELAEETENTFEIIVPRDSVEKLVKTLPVFGDTVRICCDAESKNLAFYGTDIALVSAVIEGKYPDYRKMIPESGGNTGLMELSSLKETLSVARSISGDTAIRIMMPGGEKSTGSARLWQEQASSQTDLFDITEGQVDGTFTGSGEIGFAVNAKYLAETISNLKSYHNQVRISVEKKSAPVLIDVPDCPEYRALIMPLLVRE